MKSAVETLDPTKVRLTVEVPYEELRPSLDAAYKKIAKQVNVPGFRPGKVPPRIIDQRFGPTAALEEAINDSLQGFYDRAVEDNNVVALGRPEVEITQFPDKSDFKFTAEVEIRPEFELPDYQGVEVTVDDAAVSDEDVEEQIAALRDRFASLITVERAAGDGDYVTIDLSAAVDGVTPDDGTARGLSYQVGSGGMLDGLDEAVTGLSAGESATFTSTLVGGEFADREAEVTVAVTAVKMKELPELDDDFAQANSEFDTIEELRDDVRTKRGREKRGEQAGQAQERVLEALLERIELPLPEGVLQTEIEWRKDNLGHQLEEVGMSLDDYLGVEEKTAEEFDREQEENARKAIKTQFVLDAIAAKEQLSVSESDLTQALLRRAASMRVRPEDMSAFADEVFRSGQARVLVSEIVRSKAVTVLLRSAVVTDASGAPVDLDEFIGAEGGEPESAASAGAETGSDAADTADSGDTAASGDSPTAEG